MQQPNRATLSEQGSLLYLTSLCVIAALGGFLFGFDTAVISGAIGLIETQFKLGPWEKGWVVSAALVGCIIGSAIAGWLSDRFGRKKVLVFSAVLFALTAIGCAVAREPYFLSIARLIGGIGVGVAGMVVPLYIAEISPAHLRGRMISCYQFAITIGIVAAYLTNAMFREISVASHAAQGLPLWYQWMVVDEVWRAMLGSLLLPAGAFLVLLFFVPESPRWLSKQGLHAEALAILARIAGRGKGERELAEIQATVDQETGDLGQLFRPGVRAALWMAVFLAVSCQLSGINAIIYYGVDIFRNARFEFGDALSGQVILGLVNVVFTLLAMWKVDTAGRRPLLLAGNTGVFLSLVVLGGLFAAGVSKPVLLIVFMCSYLACFAFSLGPLPWIFMAEVFPTRIRGRAMSIAVLMLWGANTLVCQTQPPLAKHCGLAVTFWIYAALIFPVFIFAWKFMPETKGRSLEELEREFAERG
jgi:MFS transporter, SP family, arabinose:H+ symporter